MQSSWSTFLAGAKDQGRDCWCRITSATTITSFIISPIWKSFESKVVLATSTSSHIIHSIYTQNFHKRADCESVEKLKEVLVQSLGADEITVLWDDVELMNWIRPLFLNKWVQDNSHLIRYIEIEDVTWPLGDTKFLFSCSKIFRLVSALTLEIKEISYFLAAMLWSALFIFNILSMFTASWVYTSSFNSLFPFKEVTLR